MRMSDISRGLLMLAALALGAAGAQAQTTHQVPGDFATIQGAIDAATAGDTILITDSGTYVGSIYIDKALTIEAAPGQNPTITNDVALRTGTYSGSRKFLVGFGAPDGIQFGSVDGGTISVVMDQGVITDTETWFPYFFEIHSDLERLTIENVYVTGENWTARARVLRDDNTSSCTVNIRKMFYNDNSSGQATEVLRLRNLTATYNIENCHFYGYTGDAQTIYGRIAYNVSNTIVDHRDGGTPITGWLSLRLNADNSLFIGNTGDVVRTRDDFAELNVENCVFVSDGGDVYDDFSQPGISLTADHCDFILLNGESDGLSVFEADAAGTKSMVVTNSNIVADHQYTTSTVPLVNIIAGGSDVITLDHNNVYGPDWSTTYDASIASVPTNSQNGDPNYAAPLAGDVSYTNAVLKTADSTGGAIGNDRSLADVVPVELSVFEVM